MQTQNRQSQKAEMMEKGNLTKADSKAEHKNQLNKAAKWQANRQIPMSTSHKQ